MTAANEPLPATPASEDAGAIPVFPDVIGVWQDVVGQELAVRELREALAAPAHAWLITGPPGSGRSTIAKAFVAALMCKQGGCGTCLDCRAVHESMHLDFIHVVPEGVEYRIDAARELTVRAAMAPVRAPWHVILVEDADRINEHAANALLKAIEEPPPHTIWLLSSPSVDDVLPTIRSRCRHVALQTPSLIGIAQELQRRYGVDPTIAMASAKAAQGHVGRARALATEEDVRKQRHHILQLPSELRSLADCTAAAKRLETLIEDEAKKQSDALKEQELADLEQAFGAQAQSTGAGKKIGSFSYRARPALRELEDRQKTRMRRLIRDQHDRVLLDCLSWQRDILYCQLNPAAPTDQLINAEFVALVQAQARTCTPEVTLRRIDALMHARKQLGYNTQPLLVLEAALVALFSHRIPADPRKLLTMEGQSV